MYKIAKNICIKERENIGKNKIGSNSSNNNKNSNKISLAYLRGLLDYNEQKYENAVTHFGSIVDRHHDAAYMAALASLKLNNHENAEFFLEKYTEQIDGWQESEQKEFAQKRAERLKGLLDAGMMFNH